MGDISLEISIPLDSDGFIEMECDYCQNRFMLHHQVYESEENINFFCPVCGLPNRTNTFFVPEVTEKIEQIALNYMLDEVDKTIGKSLKQFNKSRLINMSIRTPKREIERDLYTPSSVYVDCEKTCCGLKVKVKNIDKEIGIYCPVCGRY